MTKADVAMRKNEVRASNSGQGRHLRGLDGEEKLSRYYRSAKRKKRLERMTDDDKALWISVQNRIEKGRPSSRSHNNGEKRNYWTEDALEAIAESLYDYILDDDVYTFFEWHVCSGVSYDSLHGLMNSAPVVRDAYEDCRRALGERIIAKGITGRVSPWILSTIVPMYMRDVKEHIEDTVRVECEIRESAKARHGTSEADTLGKLGKVIAMAGAALQAGGVSSVSAAIEMGNTQSDQPANAAIDLSPEAIEKIISLDISKTPDDISNINNEDNDSNDLNEDDE